MILSNETVQELRKSYKEYMSESDFYDNDSNVMYGNLLDTIAADQSTITQLQAQVESVADDFESAAHSANNLCEFCGADCVDAGTEIADTFQCGMFKWRGRFMSVT